MINKKNILKKLINGQTIDSTNLYKKNSHNAVYLFKKEIESVASKLGWELITSSNIWLLKQNKNLNNFDSETKKDIIIKLITAKTLIQTTATGETTIAEFKNMITLNLETSDLISNDIITSIVMNIIIEILPNFFERTLQCIRLEDNSKSKEKSNKLIKLDHLSLNKLDAWIQSMYHIKTHDNDYVYDLARIVLTEKIVHYSECPYLFKSENLTNFSNFWAKSKLLNSNLNIEITKKYILIYDCIEIENENEKAMPKYARLAIITAQENNGTVSPKTLTETAHKYELNAESNLIIEALKFSNTYKLNKTTNNKSDIASRFIVEI